MLRPTEKHGSDSDQNYYIGMACQYATGEAPPKPSATD